MGERYTELTAKHIEFIKEQKIYFVATATAESRVNISPKGMDSLRVIDNNRVVWLNVTGSGNETSAHVQESPRMTIMFTAFEGKPMILRIYGKAKVIHRNDTEWDTLSSLFNPMAGARQIFDLSIDLVQSSCGMSVPFFGYKEERNQLDHWAVMKGEEGIKNYWKEKNEYSLDNIPTHIVKKGI